MAGTKAQGARIYYSAVATAWVPLAAGAYPTTGYTEITRGVDIDPKPHEVEKNDNSCLNDLAPVPEVILKPASWTFTREKDNTLSSTLRGFCDGTTLKQYHAVFVDGTAEQCSSGYLTCTNAGKATKGFANRVSETYEIIPLAVTTLLPHA